MKTAKKILLWIIGIMFITTGMLKLTQMDAMSAKIFGTAHYPIWFFYVVAMFELVGGAFLLINRTRLYGAIMIIMIMMGAIFTHMMIKDSFLNDIAPAVIIAFLFSINIGKRNRADFVPTAHGKKKN
jgi:putative oxidoreductase